MAAVGRHKVDAGQDVERLQPDPRTPPQVRQWSGISGRAQDRHSQDGRRGRAHEPHRSAHRDCERYLGRGLDAIEHARWCG